MTERGTFNASNGSIVDFYPDRSIKVTNTLGYTRAYRESDRVALNEFLQQELEEQSQASAKMAEAAAFLHKIVLVRPKDGSAPFLLARVRSMSVTPGNRGEQRVYLEALPCTSRTSVGEPVLLAFDLYTFEEAV